MNIKINSKGKTIIVVVAVLLLGAALLGVVIQLRSLMSDEEGLKDFGGETLVALDFNEGTIETVAENQGYDVSYGFIQGKVGSFSDMNGSFEYSVPAGSYSNLDPFVRFDNSRINLDEYSVLAMDFDVKVSNLGNSVVYFSIDFRKDSSVVFNNAQLRIQYGKLYSYNQNTGISSEICTLESESNHITYISSHEKTLVYVNGRFVYETVCAYSDGTLYCQGFRMGILAGGGYNTNLTVSLDNLVVNKFAPDYNGSIQKLFSNPDVLLKKNSDTIFGGAFKWPEE